MTAKQSPNADRLENWLTTEYPTLRFSRCSCRKIAGSSSWSQHAGSKETADGWRRQCNGLDIFGPDKRASASSRRLLAEVAPRLLAIKGTFHEYGWGLFHILWDGRSLTTGHPVAGHTNHIHADFYPYMNPHILPPCKGGTLQVLYPDGRTGTDFVLWSLGGHPPDGGEEDVEELVKGIQENLNAAGFGDMDGKPLVVDGVWGPRTQFAHKTMCLAAKTGASGNVEFVEQVIADYVDRAGLIGTGDDVTLEGVSTFGGVVEKPE